MDDLRALRAQETGWVEGDLPIWKKDDDEEEEEDDDELTALLELAPSALHLAAS